MRFSGVSHAWQKAYTVNLTLILTLSKPKPNPLIRAEKSHYYPTPCTALWRARGASSAALKIFLIKTLI
jgi:hypothetical protein